MAHASAVAGAAQNREKGMPVHLLIAVTIAS